MKRPILLLALTCALLPLTGAMAQTTLTSSTPVIGFYKFNVPSGKSMWTCALVAKKDFQALANSVTPGTQTVIGQNAATWSVNQFQTSASPTTDSSHYIEVLSGSNAGMVCDIVSNQVSSMTVEGNLGSTPFTYAVRRHATLASVFLKAGLSEFEDEITLFDENGVSKSFIFDGTPGAERMLDARTQTINSDRAILYPGQGFILTALVAKEITLGGDAISYVQSTPINIPLYKGKTNLVGLLNPIVAANPLGGSLGATEQQAIGNLGLGTTGLAEYEDQISVFGISGSGLTRTGIYYTDDTTGNIVTGSGSVVSTSVNIPNGTAFMITPQAADRVFKQPVLHPISN